jgi:hypothetical protein
MGAAEAAFFGRARGQALSLALTMRGEDKGKLFPFWCAADCGVRVWKSRKRVYFWTIFWRVDCFEFQYSRFLIMY